MKTENYTNLSLSKYLSEKMPFEGEMWWIKVKIIGLREQYNWELTNVKGIHKNGDIYPALTFVDLLHYLKLYGEREGWEDSICEQCRSVFPEYHNGCVRCGKHIAPDLDYKYHIYGLVNAYLVDNLTIGTHVESFLLDVIK